MVVVVLGAGDAPAVAEGPPGVDEGAAAAEEEAAAATGGGDDVDPVSSGMIDLFNVWCFVYCLQRTCRCCSFPLLLVLRCVLVRVDVM